MAVQAEPGKSGASGSFQLSDEDRSKDNFFKDLAVISEAMIAAHGREFAMGALVLAARFIAENKTFNKPTEEKGCCGGAHHHGEHHHKT